MVNARRKGSQVAQRRHECKSCGDRFTTVEAPQEEALPIEKPDWEDPEAVRKYKRDWMRKSRRNKKREQRKWNSTTTSSHIPREMHNSVDS